MWNRFVQWLRGAPIADPIDRRNAPVMQLLLLFYALLLPVNWAWRIASGGEVNEARMLILVLDMLVAALAVVSIVMIRHGRFRPAIMLFLAMQLISLEVVFARTGVLSQVVDPAPTMLTLVISGLVLGRRALWIAFALLMAVFATGFVVEVNQAIAAGASVSAGLVNLPAVVISYTLITIILDRSIKALRESLAESNARGRELQREMAERERTQAQLVHAQKMEATGRLASGIAHDFNNILGVILGFSSERHRLDDPDPDPRRDAIAMAQALEGVEETARRGAVINRKLLSFSRHEVARAETFDAADAMRELQPMLHRMLGSNVRLNMTLAEAPLPIHIDRSQFELMLLNLAANARDAMPDGGQFDIRVGQAIAGGVEIVLTDSGHGMSDAVREHAFEPFFTTKPYGSGTGLGLAVAYNLVRNARGEIDVDSAPGRGATFRVLLPPPADVTAEPRVGEGGRVRVLLVDEDEDMRELLTDILQADGCDVLAARSSTEAERWAAATPPPQVVVCDHHIASVDVAALLRRLRTLLPHTPTILISAQTAGNNRQVWGDNTELLPRPFQTEQLLRRIRAVAHRSPP